MRSLGVPMLVGKAIIKACQMVMGMSVKWCIPTMLNFPMHKLVLSISIFLDVKL